MILHCMKKKTWEEVKSKKYYGEECIASEGFIHCSPVGYMWRVAPNFKDVIDELVLLCIDTDKLEPEVRWEDGDDCGRSYPHVYGLINLDAIIKVLPYLKDENGNWIKNEELSMYPDE
ncbi:MAG TPA: DUF952 domain-containing protein [Clostridiaceae bacterium]|nr:DUF952 domain-containing protein [Clostridiaceae bacterium]